MSKENKLIIGSIVAVVIMAIGFTYAYFAAIIEGNGKNITINMTDLRIIFNGGDTIEGSNLYSEDNFDVVKTFTIENKTKSEYKYNLVIEDLVNTTVTSGSLVYKITCDDTNGYNMTEFKDLPKANNYNVGLAYNIPIASKSLQTYTIEIKYINKENEDQSIDMGSTLSGKLFIEKGSNPSLTYKMLNDNPTRAIRTDFNVTNTANTTGTLYQTNKTEDGNTVYYYSGNTTNNWVKFGKESRTSCTYNGKEVRYYDSINKALRYTNSEEECISTNICKQVEPTNRYYVGYTEEQCKNKGSVFVYSSDKATYNSINDVDIYWRIIRTNEEGSVRLLYSGNSLDTKEGYIKANVFYDNVSDDPMYVGYMYGTSGSLANNRTNENSSFIKTNIDTWYESNLFTNYDKYISKSAIYCNDRSIGDGSYSLIDFFAFGIMRLASGYPSYKCGANASGGLFETADVADKFSASTTGGGNGQLTYPIALMTADEITFAGGSFINDLSSPDTWYYTNSLGNSITGSNNWYTISPIGKISNRYYGVAIVYGSNGAGKLNNEYLENAVRPAISLSSCVKIASGDGTPDNPYVIDYENSCS